MSKFLSSAALFVAVGVLPSMLASAGTLTSIVNFTGENGANPGDTPDGSLIADSAGNLYGTASGGGPSGPGLVFELSPPAAAQTAWTETVLHAFTGNPDGGVPRGSLIFDHAGNLFGTTAEAGASNQGYGTVFELSPPAAGHTGWTEKVLLSFDGGDGEFPLGSLIFDRAGNLYGTTSGGGPGGCSNPFIDGCGEVFELTKPAAGQTAWTENVLFGFSGANGSQPSGSLIFDSAGNLYGTAERSSTSGGSCCGDGVVFELSPPPAGQTTWTEKTLYAFAGTNGVNPDGAYPFGSLIFDSAHNLYGTTSAGGAGKHPGGTVFELKRPKSPATVWTEKVLTSFTYATGNEPLGSLIFDSAGNLYGTANGRGASGVGSVFELLTPTGGAKKWTTTVLASFDKTDGSFPAGSLIFDSAGNLYGTAALGGPANSLGTVFELTP
jgi:uncharacterized repeat protein (TIGR03803 family)